MQEEYVYKVLLASEYEELDKLESYSGNARDKQDGFIHLSTKSQVGYILDKYYKGQDTVQVKIAVASLDGDKLKWDKKPTGEVFPHYYGTILTKDLEK